jgi:hypothetical protein
MGWLDKTYKYKNLWFQYSAKVPRLIWREIGCLIRESKLFKSIIVNQEKIPDSIHQLHLKFTLRVQRIWRFKK